MVKLSKTLPLDQKLKYIKLFTEFQDVFAWSYEDLKSYDTSVIQHTIPLKEHQKPFKQKLRRINPVLLPLIENKVKRMYQDGIITLIRFSEWISNIVPTRRKTGEIRLCVDLRNLNKVSLKDHYPLPKMDHILQRVVGASRISLLDGFSGFNQILVHPDDQDKTAFTTPWGTFKYVKMPFGLKNVGATFQSERDIAFSKEIHDFLFIYLDELTAFSKLDQEHLEHLRQVFLICRKYGISLNPKKSFFGLEEGKLLGHIIYKDGIRIDQDRIQAILQVPHPRNIKELQAFLGKTNFLRRFIPNSSELIRLLNNMLKKDSKVKWTIEAKQAFEEIKLALTRTPVLTSPKFDRDFIIFSFASEHTIDDVILQKDDLRCEKPIAFFSKTLRYSPLKYQIMEKQTYALVKAIKDFIIYILYSHVISYVPNAVVKDILTEEGIEGDYGGHLYWKPTVDKILRAGFYWPSLFADVRKFVVSCHKCQIFEGKRKMLPLPLKPISTERPFQQSGLDFIGEIHPSSSRQHKWILTAIGYFTKWMEAIPCRQANDSVIMQFLETNILSRFGYPEKIITDNAVVFKSKRMINFFHKYHITLGHSIAYYPQGNGLAKSSNKSLINIIKKILEENKKNWHKKMVNALWVDRLTTKRSIGTSPYELVYGMEAVFPSSLAIPVIKLLQELQEEPNSIQRRINQTIHLQQTREEVC
eukprot:PITA_03730